MGTQKICDRCGAIIPEYGQIKRIVHERHRIDPIFLPEEKRPVKWELCEACAKSFMVWFVEPSKNRDASGEDKNRGISGGEKND